MLARGALLGIQSGAQGQRAFFWPGLCLCLGLLKDFRPPIDCIPPNLPCRPLTKWGRAKLIMFGLINPEGRTK